jgi:hydroxyacylglutathione hydrolase
MKVEQFFDKGLAHLSYAIESDGQIAIIDPARDPAPYLEYSKKNNGSIIAIIETHPHADFVSSHVELSKSGADIYVSQLANIVYPHKSLADGEIIKIGKVSLQTLYTPGHSPDSISLVLQDEKGKDYAVFTGDTLFIGDVGRPDLRETAGNITAKKEVLAKQMYHSLRDKLMKLSNDVIVYPAHGAGSLCGKSMSQELSGTIGQQKFENYALQEMSEDHFIKLLLENQPLIPKYFKYNVELNSKGAPDLNISLNKVPFLTSENEIKDNGILIDTRQEKIFKSGHLKGAINIQNGGKFETWLGSIVSPDEKFYLIASNQEELKSVISKAAKIGYELNIIGALSKENFNQVKDEIFDKKIFDEANSLYTIVDIRDKNEVSGGKIFENSIHIPLSELRERINEIPTGKPIVVHCAGGYRSATGASILSSTLKDKVYDFGEAIKNYEAYNKAK